MPVKQSSVRDPFCAEALPPRELWPQMNFDRQELRYPAQLNAAAELLDKQAARSGDKIAIHHAGGRWSYGELLEKSNQIARVLTEDLGLVPGNRVLLRAPNSAMLAASWLAVIKAGLVAVCTNPLLRLRELIEIANKAQVNAALCDARFAAPCIEALQACAMKAKTICFQSDAADSLETMMRRKSTDFENAETAADDVALIAFTSGTTGQSKGTIHFHRDLLAVCDTFSRHILRPEPEDVFCGSPSLAFTYGLGGLLLFPLRAGAATVMSEQGTPAHLLATIRQYRPTISFTSPTGYRAMLKLLAGYDISSLRKCVSAGEHLSAATFEAWRRATGIKIIDGIGSTEMLHMFISSAGDDIRAGATGKVIPGYEAKILDENGSELQAGEIGRLAVRGPSGCRYLNCLEEQRKYVQNGWNLTGDSFREDDAGYFWYQARTDDMIISSGYNISAVEVETVLLAHPKVAECAVVGMPDEDRGQIVKAFVVPTGQSDGLAKELQDFVKAEIAPYKYPRAIEFVASLPRNANGKLQRFRLREAGKAAERE